MSKVGLHQTLDSLEGSWYYREDGPLSRKYDLKLDYDDRIAFSETHSTGRRAVGLLAAQGCWLVAGLSFVGDERSFGKIRLRPILDSQDIAVISNFRCPSATCWGPDMIAFRRPKPAYRSTSSKKRLSVNAAPPGACVYALPEVLPRARFGNNENCNESEPPRKPVLGLVGQRGRPWHGSVGWPGAGWRANNLKANQAAEREAAESKEEEFRRNFFEVTVTEDDVYAGIVPRLIDGAAQASGLSRRSYDCNELEVIDATGKVLQMGIMLTDATFPLTLRHCPFRQIPDVAVNISSSADDD